jgi:citrate synthase
MMSNGRRPLTAAEAAERLGIKRETLYAYVSRGQLTSRPAARGRGSEFDADEVDALLRRTRLGRQTSQELAVTTRVTSIVDGTLRYRGIEVAALAGSQPYESVATLLWTGRLEWAELPVRERVASAVRATTATLPETARMFDRLRVAVDVAAITDQLRFDLSPPAVLAAARQLMGVLPAALPRLRARPAATLELPGMPRRTDALAARLWSRLTALAPSPAWVTALNGALVVLADHELATSTFAARVAASARANPYAVVGAGMGALDGGLHGLVSELVHRLLVDAAEVGVSAAVADRLRHSEHIPGFGLAQYPDGDPRCRALLALVRAADPDPARLRTVDEVLDAVGARTGVAPNIDLALGALMFTAQMPSDAGEVIFAMARCAGWIAHALEEYEEAPLRFRLRARN